MTTANSEYFIVYTLLAALMFWKGIVCQRSYTTVKNKQIAASQSKLLYSRVSQFCQLLLIFFFYLNFYPPLSSSLCALLSQSSCSVFTTFMKLSAQTQGLPGDVSWQPLPAPPADMYLFIEKNKITALWPAGPGMPACARSFSSGCFTMMK